MTIQHSDLRLETLAITAGRPPATPGNPLSVPIVLASNFRADGGVEYARDGGTDTWEALERAVGALEGGTAVAFGSGMAAAAAILETLPTGASVVVPADSYAGVRVLLSDGAAHGRWKVTAVDITDTAATEQAAWASDLLWLESPTNPLLDVADLPRLCAFGRDRGAQVVVDNTFATPLLQRPLTLGADLVLHSATKFIGGHSDLLTGVVVARDSEAAGRIRRRRQLSGGTPGALESYLALRGLRTMPVRLERAQRTAGELARRLFACSVPGTGRRPWACPGGCPDERVRRHAVLRGGRRGRCGRRGVRRGAGGGIGDIARRGGDHLRAAGETCRAGTHTARADPDECWG
jgi:cystathionine gamma-synthase